MFSKLLRFLLPLSLFLDVVLFFRKPLFSERYMFPWDFPSVQLPLMKLLADRLSIEKLALWDPYSYCGSPIFANIQASLFHPLIFAAAWLSNVIGQGHLALLIEWAVVIQIGVAGIAAYLLMRNFGVSQAAAWTTAVMCQTGPYFASRAEHIGTLMAVSWMPVAWLSVAILAKKPSCRGVALLMVALGLAVLGGFPAATLAVFLSTALLAALLVMVKIADWRLLILTLVGCIGGVGLAAIQFIPSVQLTANSVAKYRLEWLGTGGGLKLQSLVSLVLPNHYHIFDLKNFNGPWDPSFLYLYSSILGLLLAIAAVALLRTSLVYTFTALAVFGAFLMLGDSTPLFRAVYPLVPAGIRIGIHPEYTYCIFAQSLAVLAGLGMTRLIARPWMQWSIAVVIAVDLYAVGSGRPMNCGPGGDAAGISANAIDEHPELMSAVRSLSAADQPPSRIDTMDTSINWAEAAPMTRVPTGNGCSPLAQERIIQVRLGLGEKNGRKSGWNYPVIDPGSPMVNLMGDKYLLVGSKSEKLAASNSALQAIAKVAGVSIFENRDVLPRAFLVQSTLSTDYHGAIEFIHSNARDLSARAAVEGRERPGSADTTAAAGIATITKYSDDELTISVVAPSASFLVVLDAWYPGWIATVDGSETPIYPTDVAFRGVSVPAGRHTIEMAFRPKILTYSALISVFFVGLVLALWFKGASQASRTSTSI